jgi:Zn-dependent peptidase ImmA (M78 family)
MGAYAQEFLCPSDALKDFVGEDFGEEKLDEAAHYFNVSTRLIETTLVNKGYIDRGSFFD